MMQNKKKTLFSIFVEEVFFPYRGDSAKKDYEGGGR